MCLAIPSKITHIDNEMATIDVDGVKRSASLMLLENATVGDYVIVHAGFAIQKWSESDVVEFHEIMAEIKSAGNRLEQGPSVDAEE